MEWNKNGTFIVIDGCTGEVTSLRLAGQEVLGGKTPLFKVSLLDKDGVRHIITPADATIVTREGNCFTYDYDGKTKVMITVEPGASLATFGIRVKNGTNNLVEWAEYPRIRFSPLAANGGKGEMLLPYNEGLLADDIERRRQGGFRHFEPDYPSSGSFQMFPNMVFAQFLCYINGGNGLYFGAHDETRGPKMIDFFPEDGTQDVVCAIRTYAAGDYGKSYAQDFPIVLDPFAGDWHDGADKYRAWLTEHLPRDLKKVRENAKLPDWYREPLVVVTYPVRGIHDMDKMDPNDLFPYSNALPMIDEIAKKAGCRVMALLMHWEGSAPWAPPYVWPPFGGEEMFMDFMKALHERDDLLGVYCSGFGFTARSNLIEEYDNRERIEKEDLKRAFTASPKNVVEISHICTGQRSGYDICVSTEKGKELLKEAYEPLLTSGVDYAQILDQNHGGGQYFCYSRDHGHAPCPGRWMTEEMEKLLSGWQKTGGKMLLGCESSAAEPFLPYLLMSDNRYELNYHTGRPVPLFAYLFHEYLHNFMGNQVCLGLDGQTTLLYRLAYSFSAGDIMTLVSTPKGEFMRSWGDHDFAHLPDREEALAFVGNLIAFHKEYLTDYFGYGRMIKPLPYETKSVTYRRTDGSAFVTGEVISTAWEADGKRAQIFVNPCDNEAEVVFRGEKFTIAPKKCAIRDI